MAKHLRLLWDKAFPPVKKRFIFKKKKTVWQKVIKKRKKQQKDNPNKEIILFIRILGCFFFVFFFFFFLQMNLNKQDINFFSNITLFFIPTTLPISPSFSPSSPSSPSYNTLLPNSPPSLFTPQILIFTLLSLPSNNTPLPISPSLSPSSPSSPPLTTPPSPTLPSLSYSSNTHIYSSPSSPFPFHFLTLLPLPPFLQHPPPQLSLHFLTPQILIFTLLLLTFPNPQTLPLPPTTSNSLKT